MSYTMRDGSVVEDPRLGRLKQWDDRNLNYPIRSLFTAEQILAPRSYTWSCKMRVDQGLDGACVGFGLTHELIARPVVVAFSSVSAAESFAKEKVYWRAQELDPWPGGSYPGASPRYEGTSTLAGVQALAELGYIDEYRWAFNLSDLILAVGYKGPAGIGINWYEGMMDTDENGYIHPTGQLMGGHFVILRRVSLMGGYFGGVNSWGESWGTGSNDNLGGNFRLSFDDAEDLIFGQGGEAVVPMRRSQAG